MTDEQFDGLKQHVSATVSQSEQRLTERIERLENKVDEGFAGIADIFDDVHSTQNDHERRITKLERKSA
jgi:uncharacterized protein (UPF0335 family)